MCLPAASFSRDLNSVLVRVTNALRQGGALYVSFKYGDAERFENGRFFNDMNERLLKSHLADHPRLEFVKLWITDDVRSEHRGSQPWLNAILRRRNEEGA